MPPVGNSRVSSMTGLTGHEGPVTPDSAIHQWPFDEGSGSTVADITGDADGSVNGPSWVSGTWEGGYALQGSGTDYVETATWGDFGSSMGSDFAIEFAIQTTDTGGRVLGKFEDDESNLDVGVGITDESPDGTVVPLVNDANDDSVRVYSSTAIDDGNKHHVVWNKITNDPTNWEIWIDGVSDTVNIERDEGISSFNNFTIPVYLYGRNVRGSSSDPLDMTLDWLMVYGDSLSSGEVSGRYNAQPWS